MSLYVVIYVRRKAEALVVGTYIQDISGYTILRPVDDIIEIDISKKKNPFCAGWTLR